MAEVFTQISKQLGSAAATLRQEIAAREAELAQLRKTLRAIEALAPPPGGAARPSDQRVDWNRLFGRLPGTFTSAEVARAAQKPRRQVYAVLSRWAREKRLKKTPEGYAKVPAGAPRPPKAPPARAAAAPAKPPPRA